MGVLTYPDFTQRLTPYESSVRSTALAYRFMVRRTLSQRGGAQFRAEAPADKPARPPLAPPATIKCT